MKKTVDEDLKKILTEIENIIGEIGHYDLCKGRFSDQGRKELTKIFNKKLHIAKSLYKKSAVRIYQVGIL